MRKDIDTEPERAVDAQEAENIRDQSTKRHQHKIRPGRQDTGTRYNEPEEGFFMNAQKSSRQRSRKAGSLTRRSEPGSCHGYSRAYCQEWTVSASQLFKQGVRADIAVTNRTWAINSTTFPTGKMGIEVVTATYIIAPTIIFKAFRSVTVSK
ncbi:hypothetical protein RAB80_018276 [Fusarium oxysporum f. sp. vasinfectum]|nr:hypothetical protein RAB80_018276 [Fusarium oxysporum f. sp. vasinfectum]KAK2922349.1 hypothetical protein FoTM2_017705 [Fusarium oxysporum f. sp. vasinfectum]